MSKWIITSLMGLTLLGLAACGGKTETSDPATDISEAADVAPASEYVTANAATNVDAARLLNAADTPEEWLTYGGTYDEQRFSRLTGITAENIDTLGVAWTYDLATARGVEATPIVVDGVMYVTSAWSVVYALDARTGEEKWVYDPEVDRARGVSACCDVVNRGVAVWDGKIYVGTIDGRLVALNAETGAKVWETVTVNQAKPYTITGAPRIVKGKVLIGNGGAEFGVRGYLSAYDAGTGKLAWRFYTTPNPGKQADGAASDEIFASMANETWGDEGAWISEGGGGTVWDAIIYDSVNDLVIFGVGNGSPWNRDLRDPSGGDNVFLSSIVAVRPETGEYVWHYQTTPGDSWDYTATQSLILADIAFDDGGEARRVVMQAPKNGFFYVLDAASGAFLSGDAFVPVNWAEGIDETGRPIINPEARDLASPFLQTPGPMGAHNWHPMAFSPDTGLAYIPAQEVPQVYVADARAGDGSAVWNTGFDFAAGNPVEVPPGMYDAIRAMLKGRLIAWDPVAREARWSVEHENAGNGGVLATAGNLVFQGKIDGTFAAYDASTGARLWSADVKSGAASGPGTYALDGEQYVTITTGWGSSYGLAMGMNMDGAKPTVGKVVTFKLGGTGIITAFDGPMIEKTPKGDAFGDEAMLATGMVAYSRNCAVCHGILGVSSGILPDLR
ncbi:MAG: PQQ-dependent dehydrogenase, methanol/ethanol family, partial [Hyphomonadaceae bacterium]